MNLSFCGGAYEVGASCILLQIDNRNILMDCGIRQSSSKDALPDFRTIQEKGGVDAIIVSHAHMDHTGALPIISKEYPSAKLYMNNMTKDLLKVLLQDSLKIMNNREAEIPLYAESDVVNMFDRVHTLNYEVEFEIFEEIKITFYPAGHIAGASCVYIVSKEGSVFYSGDFSIFHQRTIDGARIPKLRPDAAIFEATYGDKLHSNRQVEEERLLNIVRECIDNKGKMLVPAFALGRAQEVLLILKKAMNSKKIKAYNVYADGMVKDINRIYKLNPLYLNNILGKKVLRGVEPFYDDNIKPITSREEREKILESKEGCIIVSSSGMLTGGPSQYYAEAVAALENGYIVISGYQDEEAPGRKLLDLLENKREERILEINGKSIPVKCRIERVGLSAHGDKGEIKALISNLGSRNIFLVHGEGQIVESLAKEVQGEFPGRVYVPKSGETVDILIRNPRKQLVKQLKFKLVRSEALSAENISALWNFVYENYESRLFTAEELLIIWKGNEEIDKEDIERLQSLLLKGVYFENDLRRFFMFRAKTPSEVEELLKPRELKQNEVSDLAAEYFGEHNYRKVGLKVDTKTVMLIFDFPKALPQVIYEKLNEFEEKTKWKVEISEQTNMTELSSLVKSLLGEGLVKRISQYANEDKVLVQTYDTEKKFEKEKELFKKTTGFDLIIQSEQKEGIREIGSVMIKSKNDRVMEQNQAIAHIDESFQYEEFKPYKKSIRGKKNMELAFITAVVGERYKDKIKTIADETGWDISISNSANMNEIIALAGRLCSEQGIVLKKNPSFNAANLKVTIKPEVIEEEKLKDVKEKFDYSTGCFLEWVEVR